MMSTATRIGIALLAIVGAVMIYSVLVHVFHFIVFAAIALGIAYVVVRLVGAKALGSGNRKTLP